MQPIPLVRGWTLVPFTRFLAGVGAPVDRWLEESRISPEILQRPDFRIPFTFALDFLERAARKEGAETLGVDVGRRTAAESLGPWGFVLGRCPTLYDRAQTASRILPQINSASTIELTIEGERVRVRQRFQSESEATLRHCEDFSLMLILEAVGRAAGPGMTALEIHLPGTRSGRFDRDELFQGVKLVYGSAALQVVLPRALLARRLPELPRSAGHAPDAPQGSLNPASLDCVATLEDAVVSLLPLRCPSVEEIAHLANTSSRTLQRRLAAMGTSPREVVERARFKLADEYLRNSTASVTDTAFLLGYGDSTAFTRAFQRMTGMSPTEYRARNCDA
jgi:AraC-like DNA-binding protein